MRQTYNYRQLEKLMRSSNSIVDHIWRAVSSNYGVAVSTRDYNGHPLDALLDCIERGKRLENKYKRPAERRRFEREHEDLISRLWSNYQRAQKIMSDGLLLEDSKTEESPLGLGGEMTASHWDALLCHHLTPSNNDPQKNGTYYRESEAKPYGMTIYENLNRRVEVKRRPETPEEYRRFSKIDGVVGGRRVMPLGRRPRDTSVDAMGRRLAPDSEEATGLDSIGTSSAEYERERDRELLGNAKTYKRFTPEQYRERVEALAAHGEAIIAEEERKLGLR